jgi:NAD-dependent dihydropyrimidine dehydrogenase PreA subunit
MGRFIQITVDDGQYSGEMRGKLAAICPVDIFALEAGRVVVRPDEEDECILCEACLDLAPANTLVIRKTYLPECLLSRGASDKSALGKGESSAPSKSCSPVGG